MTESTQTMPDLERQRWEDLFSDKAALIKDPEAQHDALVELTHQLHQRGLIKPDELSDRLEQVEAAYAWGVEAQLTNELNRRDPRE